jgi:hypothetical protein
MIAFKSFGKQVTGFTSKNTDENRDKLREEVADYINNNIKAENVINITEYTHAASILNITVWYRE